MELNKVQKQEIQRRNPLYAEKMHYGYNCPKCKFDFVNHAEYTVNGIDYPIVSGHSNHEGDENWTEDHMCPTCKIEVQYSDGN